MGTHLSAQSKINFFKGYFESMKRTRITIDKNKLIAQFILTEYSTRRKAIEIIKVFEVAGIIQIIGTEITIPKQTDDELEDMLTEQQSLSREL